jgi:capsular exopolysaccharide synthesis family protein
LSKNFELLQQAEKEQELRRPSSPAKPSAGAYGASDGAPRRLRLEARTLEESVRLVQQLFVSPKEGAPRVVVFTSANEGAGCTTVCACAAEAMLTQLSGTICLVDGNLRHPSLHKVFGLENRHGLTDALAQSEPIRSYVQATDNPRLSVLSTGARFGNPFMNTGALGQRMAELRREFDYVLVDSPPANMNAEALALCHVADGAVLVLQAEVTHRAATRQTAEAIQAGGTSVLGAVLNQRNYPIPQGLYDRL